MTELQRRALARLPMAVEDVEAAYQMFKLPTVRDVCESHERLRTESQGLQALYDDARKEAERLERRLAHCHDWYAARWERLRKLIHDDARHIEDEACDVMANGATTPDDPPTYAQRLAEKDHLIAAARKDHRTALKDVENLRRMVDGLTARVAAQSELLGKRAEGNADA